MSTATIGFAEATRAQFLLLQRAGRVRMLIGAATLGVIHSAVVEWFFASSAMSPVKPGGFPLLTMLGMIVIAGAAWGIATWWHEPPGRREHLLALPVDITTHELARIAAGALWLLTMIAATAAAAMIVQVIAGRADALGDLVPAAWLSLFSAPLLAYLLTVTVATATRRSIELVLAGVVFVMITYGLVVQYVVERQGVEAAFSVFRYSLFTALGGLGTQTTTTTTYARDGAMTHQYVVVHGAYMEPYWLGATMLWFAVAAIGLTFVLWRRRIT